MPPYLDDSTLIEEWIEGSQIVLDNIPLVIEGGTSYNLQNVYGRNQRFGEPGPDDHPYNTTYTQRSWIGGLLIHDSLISRDFTKGWDGDAWVQTRGALGAGLEVHQIALPVGAPAGACTPLVSMDRTMYVAVGNSNGHIYEFVEADHTLRNPGGGGVKTFEGSVNNTAVRFRVSNDDLTTTTQMYIPTTTGYTRMGEDFTTHDEEGLPTIAFVIHEDKIYRLCSNGQVYFALDHDDEWRYSAVLPDDTEPRNAYRAADDEGNRTVAVTSSGGQYLLDHDNGILYATDLTFPEHAFQGYGATIWRVDDYISVGVGIHRKAGGLIVAAGLDDNDGLPAPLAGGFITDLEPSYNMMFAAIAGPVIGDDAPTIHESAFGLTQGLPYPLVGSGENAQYLGTNRVGAIYAWNGLGWSKFAQWNRPPTRVVVDMIRNATEVETHQHVFFGDVDGGFFTIHIPSGYYNPIQAPNLPLRRNSYYESSRIDWGAPDVPKIAKQINLKPDLLTHKPDENTTYNNEIQVVMKWRDLDGMEHSSEDADVLNGPGPYPFCSFDSTTGRGIAPIPYLTLTGDNSRRSASIGWERYKNTGKLLATGLPHDAIWPLFRFKGDPDSDTTGAVIEWYTLLCRKWMRPNRLWSFRINAQTAIKGVSEHGVFELLDSICLKKSGVPLVTGDHFYIVDVTQLGGSDEPGLNPRGTRTITCMEFTDLTYEDSINALTDL
jgi:hypothetical protein